VDRVGDLGGVELDPTVSDRAAQGGADGGGQV
jgi:hypothetical protein